MEFRILGPLEAVDEGRPVDPPRRPARALPAHPPPPANQPVPRDRRLAAIEDRIDAERKLGRGAELVDELEASIASHPLHERLRGQLMLALYRAGRQADALAAYHNARRALDVELGLEPGEELRA